MAGNVSHIHARNAALYVSKAAITFDAATSLNLETGIGSAFKVKTLTITPPESEVELINCWGSDVIDTVGAGVPVTGTFQHQALDKKAFTLGKVTGTLLFSHDEAGATTPNDGAVVDNIESLFYGKANNITDDPAYNRFVSGDLAVGNPTITVGNMIFVFNNGAGIVNVGMVNVRVTKMGDIKPTGADGHWEQEFEAVCLAKDFLMEKED